jgi:hypothetical protein
MPDFHTYEGTRSQYCSLLDINSAYDLDSNPADGVVDASTATLVGRIPRPIPGKPGYFVCAIAPAGGFVQVRRSAGMLLPDPIRYAYVAENPNTYMACGAGGYLYKLGAINAPGDTTTDFCMQCPRGSYASSAAALCIACPVNNYNDKPGQRTCKPCQYGYAPFAGAARCMGCYYGRPYCSEGYSPNDAFYTCNPSRLPEGYSPEGGYAVARPMDDPTSASAAAEYSPMFRNCDIKGGSTLVAFNVSAECKVDLYVLGDLGRSGKSCSQNAEINSITAYYTGGGGGWGAVGHGWGLAMRQGGFDFRRRAAGSRGFTNQNPPRPRSRSALRLTVAPPQLRTRRPPPNPAPNMIAGVSSPGLEGRTVGLAGVLDGEGLSTRMFATSKASRIPDNMAALTAFKLVVGFKGLVWGWWGARRWAVPGSLGMLRGRGSPP